MYGYKVWVVRYSDLQNSYKLCFLHPGQPFKASLILLWWRCRFNPWVGKIPWRREWQPSPVFLPEESHGQRSLVSYIVHRGHKELDTTEQLTHTRKLIIRKPYLTWAIFHFKHRGVKACVEYRWLLILSILKKLSYLFYCITDTLPLALGVVSNNRPNIPLARKL